MDIAIVFTKDIDKYSYSQQKNSLLKSGTVGAIHEINSYPSFDVLNKTLVRYHEVGVKNVTYLTYDEDWLGMERDLKKEYGHLFESVKALPLTALPSLNLNPLKEGDTLPSRSPSATVATGAAKNPSAHQVKTRADVPSTYHHVQMKEGSHLYLFPCNLPLAGTKKLYDYIIKLMGDTGILVIPSANKGWFQFVPQAGILTILSEYYQMKDVLKTTLFLSLTNQQNNAYAYQTKQITDASRSTLHISNRYNGLANTIPAQKVSDIPGDFPQIQKNQECYNLCLKVAEEMEAIKVSEKEAENERVRQAQEEERAADKGNKAGKATINVINNAADRVSPFLNDGGPEGANGAVNESINRYKYFFDLKRLKEDTGGASGTREAAQDKEKSRPAEPPDLTDQMVAYILKCALDFRDGKFNPDQLEKDKKSLMDAIKKAIMDDLGLKHDIAAGEQYIKDSGFELAVNAAKAVKDALSARAEFKKRKLADISFIVRMKKCGSYPKLKAMFDPVKPF
jgi:hypothetical protein